jgi:hypothetical protein
MSQMRHELAQFKRSQNVSAHLAQLKQLKEALYDALGYCTKMLQEQEVDLKADEDLFALEFGPIGEMASFLSWEIMHF